MRIVVVTICALLAAGCAAPGQPQSTDKRAEQTLNDRQAELDAYCRRIGTERRDPQCPAPPERQRASRGGALPVELPQSPLPELPQP